jgi:hypothetical protein
MPNEKLHTLTYRVVRYTPNLVRDEWVNIGILLADSGRGRIAARLVEEPGEIARVRRLHPAADEDLLRALPRDFEAQLAASSDPSAFVEKLDETLSNVVQLSPQRGVLAEDFDAELDRLYRDHVAPPRRARAGIFENTRAWIRTRINDVFRRNRLLERLDRNVRVEEFTQPGDPLRLDYAYRMNGTRGYLHALSLTRDPAQAKVLAFTAGCIREKVKSVEFAAVTELAPEPGNDRHRFVSRLLAEENIEIVPIARLDAFASRLRPRLQ